MMADPLSSLATMPEAALVDEPALCQLFGRCGRSIRRAVARGELPLPIRMFGRDAWTAGAVVQYLEHTQAEAVQRQAETDRRILAMRP